MNDIISTLILLLILPLSVVCSDRTVGKQFSTRSEVIALNGMAATSQPLATQVAIDILKKEERRLTQQLQQMRYWV
jgi:gamma-glutamyltranspeptidase/glutathione hydrolase